MRYAMIIVLVLTLSGVRALTQEPTQGSTPQPTQGLKVEPTQGSTPQPTQGLKAEPTQGSTPQPTQGLKAEPTQGSTPQPTEELTPQPTQEATRPPDKARAENLEDTRDLSEIAVWPLAKGSCFGNWVYKKAKACRPKDGEIVGYKEPKFVRLEKFCKENCNDRYCPKDKNMDEAAEEAGDPRAKVVFRKGKSDRHETLIPRKVGYDMTCDYDVSLPIYAEVVSAERCGTETVLSQPGLSREQLRAIPEFVPDVPAFCNSCDGRALRTEEEVADKIECLNSALESPGSENAGQGAVKSLDAIIKLANREPVPGLNSDMIYYLEDLLERNSH